MPLRSQGYCAVGRGLSGLHWVRCNGRGPHLEWRQETHVSSPDFPWARSDSDRSFAAEFEQESQASSCVEEWNSACLSSCSRGDRSLLELCVVPAGFSGRYPGVSVPLRVVPSSKGLSSKRCPGIGILSRANREIGVFRHVSPSTRLCLEYPRETGLILRCTGKGGNPFKTKQGNRPSCRDQEGRRGPDVVVPGTSVFSSSQTGVSRNF